MGHPAGVSGGVGWFPNALDSWHSGLGVSSRVFGLPCDERVCMLDFSTCSCRKRCLCLLALVSSFPSDERTPTSFLLFVQFVATLRLQCHLVSEVQNSEKVRFLSFWNFQVVLVVL